MQQLLCQDHSLRHFERHQIKSISVHCSNKDRFKAETTRDSFTSNKLHSLPDTLLLIRLQPSKHSQEVAEAILLERARQVALLLASLGHCELRLLVNRIDERIHPCKILILETIKLPVGVHILVGALLVFKRHILQSLALHQRHEFRDNLAFQSICYRIGVVPIRQAVPSVEC